MEIESGINLRMRGDSVSFYSMVCADVSWISRFPEEMEVLFRRGIAIDWQAEVINEDENGQIASISIGSGGGVMQFSEKMSQLLAERNPKTPFYLPNDELAFSLNTHEGF